MIRDGDDREAQTARTLDLILDGLRHGAPGLRMRAADPPRAKPDETFAYAMRALASPSRSLCVQLVAEGHSIDHPGPPGRGGGTGGSERRGGPTPGPDGPRVRH